MSEVKRTALKHIGVHQGKEQKKRYQIEVTEEQIALIRTYAFRTEQLYIRHNVNRFPDEEGTVIPVITNECYFCNKGSVGEEPIPHTKDCIVPFADREYGALNEQFLKAEGKGEADE